MSVDRFIAISQLLWPVLILIARRVLKTARRIERKLDTIDALRRSDTAQWVVIRDLRNVVTELQRRVG